MRLYELKKGAKLYETLASEVGKVYNTSPLANPVIVDRPDGAYIICYLQSNRQIVTHIARTAEVVKHKDGWKLAREEPLSGGEQTTLI